MQEKYPKLLYCWWNLYSSIAQLTPTTHVVITPFQPHVGKIEIAFVIFIFISCQIMWWYLVLFRFTCTFFSFQERLFILNYWLTGKDEKRVCFLVNKLREKKMISLVLNQMGKRTRKIHDWVIGRIKLSFYSIEWQRLLWSDGPIFNVHSNLIQ